MCDLSIFLGFSVKPAVSWRESRAVTMGIGTRDSVDGSGLKTTHESALFPCTEIAGGCELALAERIGGLKTASLGVVGLA